MFRKVIQRRGILLLAIIPFVVTATAAVLAPGPQHLKSTALIAELVKNYHYSRPELDDDLSSSILSRYIDALDPNKHFFKAGDIQSFEQYRYTLDDALRGADTTPAFEIYNVFRLRVRQRIDYALEVLEQPFEFTKEETYRIDYEDASWLENDKKLDDLWRKRVKNDYLTLKLAGKAHDKIIETLAKRYQQVIRRTNQQTSNDVYQLFVNAYTTAIDPHSTYFSPHNSENFNINMRLSLEGIGAALRSKNEYTMVQRIIKGGPADISGQLKAKDKIIGVAQDQGEMVDVIGWRLQDVVELIRGPKDSVVRLLLQPHRTGIDGPSKEITLVRDKIKLEEQAAKSSVIEVPAGQGKLKIGVIDLPTFYLDFDARSRGDANYKSTTRDVKKIITDLKRQSVDGIVIDLRSNGGGSLSEATELTGLFIKSGPVVQVKGTRGDIEVNEDPDDAVAYTGPLAVLVDHYSASASEIFAGAIQDYGRGLIIGEPTFGKGTVQTLVDLNRFDQGDVDLGQLKVTIAQFFRINGDSTQHRGVRPDIVFPTVVDDAGQGERSLDNALPWAKVAPADYEKVSSGWFNLNTLRSKHQARISKDAGFTYLVDASQSINQLQKQKSVSLSEKLRRNERNNRRKHALEMENKFRLSRGLKPLTMEDKDHDEEEDVVEETEEDEPAQKIQVEEAANILTDYIMLQRESFAASQKL
jgi:carboxyl-terminal processing protease